MVNINYLVDTGTTLSILHPAKYRQIPENMRPEQQPAIGSLKTAGGGSIVPEGYSLIPLNIANHIYWSRMVITSIDAPAVIGCDFLCENQCRIDVRQVNWALVDFCGLPQNRGWRIQDTAEL